MEEFVPFISPCPIKTPEYLITVRGSHGNLSQWISPKGLQIDMYLSSIYPNHEIVSYTKDGVRYYEVKDVDENIIETHSYNIAS